jgi:hypothetical protein
MAASFLPSKALKNKRLTATTDTAISKSALVANFTGKLPQNEFLKRHALRTSLNHTNRKTTEIKRLNSGIFAF